MYMYMYFSVCYLPVQAEDVDFQAKLSKLMNGIGTALITSYNKSVAHLLPPGCMFMYLMAWASVLYSKVLHKCVRGFSLTLGLGDNCT